MIAPVHLMRPVFCGVLLLALAACSARVIERPVETALDRSESRSRRQAAIAIVPQEDAMGLLPLIYSQRHPLSVRTEALDRMIALAPDPFWRRVAISITRVNDWPMLNLLCERAGHEERQDLIPALVLSWARPSKQYGDRDRPERAALGALLQDESVEEGLWRLVESSDSDIHDRYRVAAWAVLSRLRPADERRARVQASRADSGLAAELKLVSDAVDVMPVDREGVLRMRSLLANAPAEAWDRWEQMRLDHPEPSGPHNLSLRHLPSLSSAAAGEDPVSFSYLADRLRSERHIPRGLGSTREVVTSTPDRLADHAESLGWADRLVLYQILEAIVQTTVRRDVFAQADADMADETTEHGGVLRWDGQGRWVATPFPPARRQHDQIFHASDACVDAMHLGLAHYHFHAQAYDNAVWAGPGGGDFAFADALHANCVVFTFIDRNTLNVDAYFPGNVVIDLGCITRPLD